MQKRRPESRTAALLFYAPYASYAPYAPYVPSSLACACICFVMRLG